MRLTSMLMASTAALVLVAAAPAHANGFYFSTFGGGNFLESQDRVFTGEVSTLRAHFDPDAGFLLGSAVGLGLDNWLAGLKVEIEASYRRNSLGGHWIDNGLLVGLDQLDAQAVTSGDISGFASTFALMTNAWYEFSIGTRFKPYVGGGVGWARSKIDGVFERSNLVNGQVFAAAINPFSGFVLENSGFAFQLGAGVTTEVMPGVSLGLGYRYFDGPNSEFTFGGLISSLNDGVKFDNVNQSVALSLTIDIN